MQCMRFSFSLIIFRVYDSDCVRTFLHLVAVFVSVLLHIHDKQLLLKLDPFLTLCFNAFKSSLFCKAIKCRKVHTQSESYTREQSRSKEKHK